MNAARPEDRRPDPAEPTRRIPAARTGKLPRTGPDAGETQRLPASHTEEIPETHPERPTRAMRQVRRLAEEGPWPAIPMLPVITPEPEPLSEVERIQEYRGVRALRDYLDREQTRDPDAPAWPQRRPPEER